MNIFVFICGIFQILGLIAIIITFKSINIPMGIFIIICGLAAIIKLPFMENISILDIIAGVCGLVIIAMTIFKLIITKG